MLSPWQFPRIGEISLECVFKSPSDTLNPHERPFTGMLDRHPPSASGYGGCFLFALTAGPVSFLSRSLGRGLLAALADGDGDGGIVPGADGADGAGVRVVGEHGARGAQPVDQVRGRSRGGDASRAH